MTSARITPVILSGGSGTRLWPLSTAAKPKQFLPLLGDASMFRATLDRVANRTVFAAPIIVCGEEHVPPVESELADAGIADARIIVEPAARNTAPAIALAAIAAPDAMLLVMPSDHAMRDPQRFQDAVACALPAAQAGSFVTFGIAPSTAETGYGYIATGGEMACHAGVFMVERFVEKPDIAGAQAMLDAGGHLWNAGIFLMRADSFLSALESHASAIARAAADAMTMAHPEGARIRPDPAAFAASPSDSIDYAVMEKTRNVVVVPVDPGWSDVGSFSALHALMTQDDAGNALNGDVLALDCSDNLIRADAGVRVTALGIDNLIIVATGREVLVLPMDRAQDIRRIVAEIKERG